MKKPLVSIDSVSGKTFPKYGKVYKAKSSTGSDYQKIELENLDRLYDLVKEHSTLLVQLPKVAGTILHLEVYDGYRE